MKSVKTLSLPVWLPEEAQDIVKILNDVQESSTMFVGGCVRNALLNEIETDIDLATTHKPDAVLKILSEAGLKVVPTGIEHGTITAVKNNIAVEVTTLREDVATYGRHADVKFSKDWQQDAVRRDFTMNALYMDLDGNIYDPTGEGIEDLENRNVKFVGDADSRIKEDYLRILRFFRFNAQYGQDDIDQNTLAICTDNKDGLKQLSRERITKEFFKIIYSDRAVDVLDTMFKAEILDVLRGKEYNVNALTKLMELQTHHQSFVDDFSIPLTRYFILSGAKAKFHDDILIFSKAQAAFVIKLETIARADLYQDEKSIKRTMIQHGRDFTLQGYFLLSALDKINYAQSIFDLISNWEIPECPITGEMLLKEGYQTGPELGQELERRKQEWLEEIL